MTDTRISTHKHVSMQYSLTTGSGAVIRAASGKPPIQYVHGCGNLFPKLELALEGHGTGDIVRVRLLPDDAFGRRDTELLHEIPLDSLPPGENLAVGNTLVGEDDQGQSVGFRITAIENGVVKLDANHPLAGETLVFEVEIQSVREATPAEVAQAQNRDDQRRID
jgi:FKBP-type peptidyl-prolyl cis-trans isomerase SlyD